MNFVAYFKPPAWLGFSLFLAALAVPSPLVGWFDGLPWSNPQEMVFFFGVLPPAAVAAWRLFSHPRFFGVCLCILFAKILLIVVLPWGGLKIWMYENSEQQAEQVWERTWDTLWHPGVSAVARRDLRDAREFPVEWVNRIGLLASPQDVKADPEAFLRHPVDRKKITPDQLNQIHKYIGKERFVGEVLRKTMTPVLTVQGWVFLLRGESLLLYLDKFPESGSLLLAESGGNAVSSAWQQGTRTLAFQSVEKEGWYEFKGSLTMPPLEECDTNLCLRIQDEKGGSLSAFAMERIWTEKPKIPGLACVWLAPTLSRLMDGLCLAGFCVLAAWGIRSLATRTGGTHLLGLVVAGVASGWVARWAGWPVYECASVAALVPVLGGIWLTGRHCAAGLASWQGLFLVLSLALVPLFMKHWWGEAPRMGFFSVGDDWLTFQNQARNIFVFGDWLNFRTDPVYGNQPGSRYWVGLGHLLFGQSPLSTRMIDLWSVVATCVLLAATALRLGSSVAAVWMAGGVAAAVFFWPPAGGLVGAGLQEPLATAALAAVFYRAVSRVTAGPCDWILAFWICWAFWLRMDHLPAILAGGLLLLAPGLGDWREIHRQWMARIRQNSGRVAWFLFWVGFALAVVLARNLWAGTGLTLTSGRHMASKLPGNFLEALQMPILILRADSVGSSAISPMGWFLLGGFVIALFGVLLRLGSIRRIPLEPCLILFAAMAPYFLLKELAYAPRFSFHFVPVAGLLWASLITIWADKRDESSQAGLALAK